MKNKKLLIIGAIILALVVGLCFFLGNRENEIDPPEQETIATEPIETIPTEPVIEETEPSVEETEPSEEVTEPTEPDETEPTTPTKPEEEETKPTEPEKEEQKEEVKPKPAVTFKSCEKTMYVVSKTLNVRRGPGTEYEKIGIFAQWEYVRVRGIGSNGWYLILFNDEIAYVAGNYLADIEVEETEPSEPTTPPVETPTEPEATEPVKDTTPPITEPEVEDTTPPVTEP